MSFNPYLTKPAEEILFLHKRQPQTHPSLFFNGVDVKMVSEHEQIGLIFDPKLNFTAHFKEQASNGKNIHGARVGITTAYGIDAWPNFLR